MQDKNNLKIYVAGHNGLVGSAILQELNNQSFKNIIYRTRRELDLTDKYKTEKMLLDERPDIIFLAAAKVGGIGANNKYPVDFLMTNLKIQTNVFEGAYKSQTKRLIFLGSSCIYPKKSKIPIKEEYLLTSELEPTNRPYAIAKISGIEMCWSFNRQFNTNFLAAMPTNIYGPNDNYDLNNSHVLPALIRKIHDAKIKKEPFVEIWGTGKPKREFLHSLDLAKGLIHLMKLDDKTFSSLTDKKICPLINIGSGLDLSIKELAQKIMKILRYNGDLKFNTNMPDGTNRKVLNVDKILSLGWKPQINLDEGINSVYENFLENYN